MNLTFLNPLFLFGLVAGVIPILIHRLTHQRAVTRRFSAVRLLLQSQRVMSRPQRLKNLLLLALRVTALMALAFLMAQPILTRQGLFALGNETAKVLILDNSLSMGYMEENGRRYDQAKKAAKAVMENLRGQILIIPTAGLQSRSAQGGDLRWMSPEEALKGVDKIPLSYGRGDPGAALGLGYLKLSELKGPGEILIISDMARGDWEGFDLSKVSAVSSDARMTFLRMGRAKRDSNFTVKGMRLAEGEAVAGGFARLEVTVSNLSDEPGNILVQIYLSGIKKEQKAVEIRAGGEGKAVFETFFESPGWVDGEVRLSEDRLSLDDRFYFSMKVREKIKVLIVDGSPGTSLMASESYYLANALIPGGSEGSPFIAKVVTEDEFAYMDPKSFEAFFLLNVARPQSSKLYSILESGRPVFIFLGDRVIPEEYNSLPLLPWRIRELKEAESLKITGIDNHREIMKSLSIAAGESLKSASFHRYFKIDGRTKNLLIFGNKDPLLIETDLGKGKLFLYASSADIDWNDLPLKASYLPLIQGLLKEAVGLQKDSLPESVRSGESSDKQSRPTQVKGPEGGPGIYKSLLASGEVRYGINPAIEESDLSKVTEEELKKRFGKIEVKVEEYREGATGDLHGSRKELWPFLLAFLLVVLGVEMGIANGVSQKRS